MIRSSMLFLTTGCAAVLSLAFPQLATAQYRGYQAAPQYSRYQPPPYRPYQQGPSRQYQAGPTLQDLGGDWYMNGDEDQPCQIIPSQLGDRAMFINENGEQAEGFLRGSLIVVPQWGNLKGRFHGHGIRWANSSVWTR